MMARADGAAPGGFIYKSAAAPRLPFAARQGHKPRTRSSAPLVDFVEKGPSIEFVASAAGVECAQR